MSRKSLEQYVGARDRFDEAGVSWPAVTKTSAGFEMWYTGSDSTSAVRLGYATSPDGLNWTKVDGNETNGATFDEANFASILKEGMLYKMWYGINNMDIVNYATSTVTDLTGTDVIIPDRFILEQNYPNPFNPTTTISFEVPRGMQIDLTAFDITGKRLPL